MSSWRNSKSFSSLCVRSLAHLNSLCLWFWAGCLMPFWETFGPWSLTWRIAKSVTFLLVARESEIQPLRKPFLSLPIIPFILSIFPENFPFYYWSSISFICSSRPPPLSRLSRPDHPLRWSTFKTTYRILSSSNLVIFLQSHLILSWLTSTSETELWKRRKFRLALQQESDTILLSNLKEPQASSNSPPPLRFNFDSISL